MACRDCGGRRTGRTAVFCAGASGALLLSDQIFRNLCVDSDRLLYPVFLYRSGKEKGQEGFEKAGNAGGDRFRFGESWHGLPAVK